MSQHDTSNEEAHNLSSQRTLLIGTRRSQLATTQSGHVQAGITEQGWTAELHIVHTPGDASQASQIPVAQIGVGVFTETLRNALAAQECDVAVHSFKDLPTAPDQRFRLIVPERVDPREALISVDNRTLADLPQGRRWEPVRRAVYRNCVRFALISKFFPYAAISIAAWGAWELIWMPSSSLVPA